MQQVIKIWIMSYQSNSIACIKGIVSMGRNVQTLIMRY